MPNNEKKVDKAAIYDRLVAVMVDLFEVDPAAIHPDADLIDDLDIDSIDAVDIAVEMQAFTGQKIHPEQFKEIRSVQDVVDAVFALVDERASDPRAEQSA